MAAGVAPAPAPAPTPATVEWTGRAGEIVGDSPLMRELLAQVEQYAPYDEVVLITGETGTGKELIARQLHASGPRAKGPFTAVNVATLDAATAASALFGHIRGAYTGAEAHRLGAFRSSEEGTLFLDEIGELSPDLQARILRAVELKEIVPLGEDRPRHVDVRVVAATNRDLATMIREGTFREDLYQRLRQFPLRISPLRERPDDIPLLTRHFLRRWNRRYDTLIDIAPEAIAVLQDYHWPGNVRQLENVLKRLCVPLRPDGTITGEAAGAILADEESSWEGRHSRRDARPPGTAHAPPSGPEPRNLTTANPVDLRSILEETERGWYRAALGATEGNQAEAARLLGLNPPAFRKALRDRFSDLLE
ncbi:MAG: sigma-54-dependent Fis family transcriptional regulator [Spirochaetaceae bacterium]|nr:MAG: sigma-54-dependent Fis family transcriptional regulator [Spirochaetaceae bacterium]